MQIKALVSSVNESIGSIENLGDKKMSGNYFYYYHKFYNSKHTIE